MDAEQKQKLTDLCTQQHVAVLTTQGEEWPTAPSASVRADRRTGFDPHHAGDAEKYHNLLARPQATVVVDNRDTGDVSPFRWHAQRYRASRGEVTRDSDEWNELQERFLAKNPFEEPFFGYDNPAHDAPDSQTVSYANGLADTFKVEL